MGSVDFDKIIREHTLLDIITVDDTHYAISTTPKTVPGCVVVLASQLPNHLSAFLRSGFSHRYGASYSAAANLKRWVLLTYRLTELPAKKKQLFSHALSGSAQRKGLLASWRGEKVGRLAFFVPKEFEADAIGFLNHWSVPYTSEVVFRAE